MKIDKNLSNKLKCENNEQLESISTTIDENFAFINSYFGNGIGLVATKYYILDNSSQIGLAYIESMSDNKLISTLIIEPLLKARIDTKVENQDVLQLLQTKFIYIANIRKAKTMGQVIDGLLNGNTILFLNGCNAVLVIGSAKIEKRAIEKPENEVTTLASMESFNEDLSTNCNMVIKRLPTHKLRVEAFTVGTLSKTEVRLIYIEDLSNSKTVEEVKRRLAKIDIDFVDGIGTLSELIQENSISIFPKYKQTQRSDVTAKNLSDGHFALLCSNSPFAMIAPISFWDNLKTMDDYAEKTVIATYSRVLRLMSFGLSVLVSPLYLAFVTYNHSIVPPQLAINITNGRQGVPFPSFIELLFMTLLLSIIHEASVRLPGTVGYFIGALSAVVIGQATVSAGYVSASVIIVAAISTVSSFAVSSTTLLYPSRIINYFLIVLSGILGMFGIINGIAIIIWHLLSLESFGTPYLYPLVPLDMEALKDTIIRGPYSKLKKRFNLLVDENDTKISNKEGNSK